MGTEEEDGASHLSETTVQQEPPPTSTTEQKPLHEHIIHNEANEDGGVGSGEDNHVAAKNIHTASSQSVAPPEINTNEEDFVTSQGKEHNTEIIDEVDTNDDDSAVINHKLTELNDKGDVEAEHVEAEHVPHEDVKAEEVDAKLEESKLEESKLEESKHEESKHEESKHEEVKAEGVKVEEVKAKEVEAEVEVKEIKRVEFKEPDVKEQVKVGAPEVQKDVMEDENKEVELKGKSNDAPTDNSKDNSSQDTHAPSTKKTLPQLPESASSSSSSSSSSTSSKRVEPNKATQKDTKEPEQTAPAAEPLAAPIMYRSAGPRPKLIELQQEVHSFALFYGGIPNQPTAHERKILNGYDLVVLDLDNVQCSLSEHRQTAGRENADFTRACQYVTKLKSSKVPGLHGIYIADMEEATTMQGADYVVKKTQQLVKEAQGMLIFTNGMTAFGSSEYLQQHTHGLVLDHPTMNCDGEYKLLPNPVLTKALEASKIQMQRRVDFVVLAHECVPQGLLKGAQVTRFVKFCQAQKLVPTICVDRTHSRAELVQQVNPSPSGPLAVLAGRHVEDFLTAFKAAQHRKGGDKNTLDKTVLITEIQTLAQRLGHDIDTSTLQSSLDSLQTQYSQRKESVYLVWIGLASFTFQEMAVRCEQMGITKLAEMYGEVSRLFKVASQCEELHARHFAEGSVDPTEGSNKTLAVTVKYDVLEKMVADGDVGEGSSGQREFGIAYRENEYNRVVEIQERLRRKNLLRNLSKKTLKEVCVEGAEDIKKMEVYETKFLEMLEIIDNIIYHTRASDVYAAFDSTMMLGHLKQLRTALEAVVSPSDQYCAVQLWEADPQSLRFESLAGERRYFSVWKRDDNASPKILHVYIGRHHPNLAEAVVHAYFSSRGYTHTACVILETLCRRAEANPTSLTNTEAWRQYTALPERFIWQLARSSYRDLARYVLQSQKIALRLKNSQLPEKQRAFALKMCEQVKAVAKGMLLDDVTACEMRRQRSNELLGINGVSGEGKDKADNVERPAIEGLQEQLENLFQEASWQEGALAVMDNVLRIITFGVRLTNHGARATLVPSLMNKVLTEAGRRNALDELEMQVRDSNAYLLRESDLVTVYLEFNGLTDPDSQRLFEMSKFHLGKVLYNRIRDKMEQENPPIEYFDPPKGSYDEKLDNVLSAKAWMLNWANGMFFMLFMAINLAVVLATGTGAYTSTHMLREHSQSVALGMISAFISAGSINACISRLGSMYMYQWSFALSMVMLTRLVVCGFLIGACVVVVAGIPMLLLMDPWRAAIFLIFYLLFLMMLVMMGALLTIKRGSVWTSAAGLSVLAAQFVEIIIVFVLFYIMPFDSNPLIGSFGSRGAVVHMIGLLVCVVVMAIAFFILAHKQTTYISRINPTKDDDVYTWYAEYKGVVKPPSPNANDDALSKWYWQLDPSVVEGDMDAEKAKTVVRLAKKEAQQVWTDARKTFSAAVEQQKKRLLPSRGSAHQLVKQRAANYDDEELLMKWYILLSSKPRPEPCSRDWDALLVEGKDAYMIKYKTDSIMRGGLLWDTVAPDLIRGTFYYALLFCDRIVQLIYTGSGTPGWFLPTSRYELTAGWGLVCLLVSISCLEAIPFRLLSIDLGAPIRYDPKSGASDLDMVRARRQALRRFYFLDKIKVIGIYLVCAAVFGVILWWYSNAFPVDAPLPPLLQSVNGTVALYGAFALGFLGFVLGTYNSLFLSDCLAYVGISLAVSTIVGIIAGYISVVAMNNSDASVIAMIVAGWLYYILTVVKFLYNSYRITRPSQIADSKWGALQNSAMMTSGQRWVGSDLAEEQQNQPHLVQHLLDASKCVVLTPDTDTGLEVANLIQKAHTRWNSIPENSLLRAAFPHAGEMFHNMMQHWHAEKIVLSVVEEGDLKLAHDEGFSAFSVSTGSGEDTVLQVFVGLTEDSSARRLAEALVHEYAEQSASIAHRRAVIAELLLSTDVNMEVPSRIMRQLSTASRKRLLRLADDTDETILDLVAGKTTMDKWESLTTAARIAAVAALELPVWALLSPTGSYVPTFATNDSTGSLVLEQGISDLQEAKCWPENTTALEHVASVILASQMAISIKRASLEMCASRMTAYTDQQQTIPILVPAAPAQTKAVAPTDDLRTRLLADKPGHHGGGIRQRVDAFLRLGFLAFTADETFAQEWAYVYNHRSKQDGASKLARVLSMPLLLIYNAGRRLIEGILWAVLCTRRKELGLLFKQLSRGVYGNETRNDQGLLLRMQYHTPGARPRTAFVKHNEVLLAGNAVPEGEIASTMELYPQLLETEPEDKRGREATVLYLPDGKADRVVDYANGAVKSIAIFNHSANKDFPESKFAYKTTNANIVAAPRSEVMRCAPLYVVHYDDFGRPQRVTFHHEYQGHKTPISATYRYANDDPSCEPTEVDYNRVPDVSSSTGFNDYYKLTVRYHKFTSRVHSIDSKKEDGTGSTLRTFFIYRNLKHCNKITFRLNEKGEMGRTPTRFLTPVIIKDDAFKLVGVAPMQSIESEIMVPYQTRNRTWQNRWLGKLHNKKRDLRLGSQYSTLKARVMLWKSWNKGKLEGVFTGMWDESILRKEPDLQGYWRKRDWGKAGAAIQELEDIQTTVTAKIQPDASHPELRTHKLIKVADMINLVPGGGCTEMASAHSDNKIINDLGDAPALDVVGLDSGTWPADGGGVASCRRDLVDRLRSVAWTQMAEVGTPMKLTQYQIEQNVRSLTLVPLWGDILGDPCASIYTATPYSTLAARKWRTTPQIIERYFVPLLRQFVDACALQPEITDSLLEEHTSMIVNLYTFFQEYDWLTTWTSPLVSAEWRSRWCQSYGTDSKPSFTKRGLLAAEYPTVTDLDMLLSLFGHFLFPITVPLPPHPVYHASHHGVQTILGVIARQLYGSSLVIWDHGMLWREKTKAIAELWQFTPFVRNGLLGLSRLTLHINYYNATTVSSCCTRGNPDWELWLGGRGGTEHTSARTDMYWRMSPVVNGMETDKFMPRHSQESPEPTVVQLSHVYDLKDIKTAIRAAAIIVNVFKLTTYRLLVFGSTNKDVDYTSECKELISSEGLSSNVFLMGLADATKVLAQGWLFLNSSQSEGLPLALGEAGLSGLPVVCTDVGGSREVVTDGETVLGRVCPPRNPMAVARAEVEVLAMLSTSELAEYEPIAANAGKLLARMKEAVAQRRRLGNKYRTFVMDNFGMERYLREHEQQIWLGSMRCDEIRMEAVAMSKDMAVRHAPASTVRHFRLEVAPQQLTEVKDGEAASSDALFDLYADMSFRMIEAVTHKNRQDFIQQFASRNNSPRLRRMPYKQTQPVANKLANNGSSSSGPSGAITPKQKLMSILSPKLHNPFRRGSQVPETVGSPALPSKSTRKFLASSSLSNKNLASPAISHSSLASSSRSVAATPKLITTPTLPTEVVSPPLPASPAPVRSAPVLQLSSTVITRPTEHEPTTQVTTPVDALPEAPTTTAAHAPAEPIPTETAHSAPPQPAQDPPTETVIPRTSEAAKRTTATQDTETAKDVPTENTTPFVSPLMRASPRLSSSRANVGPPALSLTPTDEL